MSTFTGRNISKVVLFSLVLALTLTVGWAGTIEGSTDTARPLTDTALGQVMIYNGGFFDNGVTVSTFKFFDANGTGARFVTPILFEETSTGSFVVRAIGATDSFSTNGDQTFAFASQNGSPITTSGVFTFGFIEAAVTSNGDQSTSSTGGVDLTNPFEGPSGVSAGTTNDWVFTPTPGSGGVNVHIGQSFNIPGVGAGVFPLNASTRGGFDSDRTYSANLNTISAGVPEPGTLTLFTSGAGLMLAGLLRFRRRRS
jgi:hypothetical protein